MPRLFTFTNKTRDRKPSARGKNYSSAVAEFCSIEQSKNIEGREGEGGVISPNLEPRTRLQWAEAFYLIVNKARLGYTLEAPSDFPLATRVNAARHRCQVA